jgi:hypothetical protein
MSYDAIAPTALVHDLTLLEWFAGCALANPDVTGGLAPKKAVEVATTYASGMVQALKAPKLPSRIDAPTKAQMDMWVQIINKMSAETTPPNMRINRRFK